MIASPPDSPTPAPAPATASTSRSSAPASSDARSRESFAIRGWRRWCVEKAADILEGASKGNSALLHTGYDEPPKAASSCAIVRPGFDHLPPHPPPHEPAAGRDRRPRRRLVAEERGEARRHRAISPAQRHADAAVIGADELRRARAAAFDRDARGAVLDAGRGDHRPVERAARLYHARRSCMARRSSPAPSVRARRRARDGWRLDTAAGEFAARLVVNAAGLFGDQVERLRGAEPGFTIRPRKGQFIVFDKPAHGGWSTRSS